MATRIKSSQIADGAIVAADLHSAIAINTTQSGTFGSVVVDTITIDAAAIATTANMTLDSGSDIILDADGGNIMLKDATVWFGNFNHNGNNLAIDAKIADGSIVFRGTDGSTPVTALTLDMSNAGDATFNSHVKMNTGSSTGKFAVMSTSVHGSYDFYNNGTSYFNGSTQVDDVLTISDTTTSTSASTGSLQVLGGAGIAENLNVGGNVVVTGNLTVEGTQVTLNTSALDVEDKNITLNYHATNDTSASADNSGITIQDAVSQGNDATILWDTTDDKFDFSHSIHASGELRHYNTYNSATESLGTRLIADAGSTSYSHPQVDMRRWTGSAQNHYTASIELSPTNADGHALVVMSDTQTSNTKATTERFRIDNTGNVGIGNFSSTAPAQPLHVDGATKSKNLYLTNASNSSQSDAFIYWSDGSGTSELTFDANSSADSNIKFSTSEPAGSSRTAMWLQGDDWEDGGQSTTVYGRLKVKDGYGSTGAYENGQVRHTVRPSLLLDFANSKKLDPRITFTRSTTGTYWDGKTTVKAEENLIPNSSDIDTFSTTTYTVYDNVTTAPDGTNTAQRISPNSSGAGTSIAINSGVSKTTDAYVWSSYFKMDSSDYPAVALYWNSSGSANVRFDIQSGSVVATVNGNGTMTGSIENAGNGWYRCISTYSGATATDATIYVLDSVGSSDWSLDNSPDGVKGVYVWGPQIEKRSAVTAYTPTTGSAIVKYQKVLQTAAAGQARFDHDPITGESKGLLIEKSATNYAGLSIPSTAWGLGAQMVTPNYAIAPDGTHTAAFIHESATNVQQLTYTTTGNTLTSGSTYTFSVYAKAYTHASFQLHSYGDSSKDFNLASPSNSSDSTMTYVGNGWYRCTWTKTKSNTSSQMYLGFSGSSYAGDANKGLLFWGAQVELGTFATSHIPTAGSAVTRSPDQPTVTGSDFDSIYNVSEGTVFARFMFGYDSDVDQRYIVSGGDGYARWLYTNAGDNNSIVDYDSASGSISNTTADNVWSSAAQRSSLITLKKNIAANGQVDAGGERNATGTINTLSTEFRIGHGTGNAGQMNGWMSKFAYYPKALTDAELIALTEE